MTGRMIEYGLISDLLSANTCHSNR